MNNIEDACNTHQVGRIKEAIVAAINDAPGIDRKIKDVIDSTDGTTSPLSQRIGEMLSDMLAGLDAEEPTVWPNVN